MTRVIRWMVAALLVAAFVHGGASAEAQRGKRRARSAKKVQVEAPAAEATGAEAELAAEEAAEPTAPSPVAPPPASASASAPEPAASGAQPAAPAAENPSGPGLAALREEFAEVMDALVQLRSRVSVLGRQLFETRVRVRVDNQTAETQSLVRLVVSLDGAPVHQAEGAPREPKPEQVFDGYAAPGLHVITVEAEQRAKAGDKYRHTTRDTFRFEALRGKATVVTITLEDDSDIAEDFADDEAGEYDVRTRVRVEAKDLK